MARIVARRDEVEGYVYFKSIDGFRTPVDAREVISRNGGDFSDELKEWRAPVNRGAVIVAALKAKGHNVIAVDAHAPARPQVRGPLECAACAQPYRATRRAAHNETCVSCAEPLELVEPPEDVTREAV